MVGYKKMAWKDTTHHEEGKRIGFIAQQAKEIIAVKCDVYEGDQFAYQIEKPPASPITPFYPRHSCRAKCYTFPSSHPCEGWERGGGCK